MPTACQQLPQTQKRLTNVSIVRLKSHGKRFEIACYKNKVLNWREGIEKDLAEVIQIDTIFTNVSKGDVANDTDLRKAFGTIDQEEIVRTILKKGDLQVSDKERELHLETTFRDIVQMLVERCVHPQTGRQLTAITVESALKKIGFSVHCDHSAKKQSLKAMESLCAEMPEAFARAKMRLRLAFPERLTEEIKRHLAEENDAKVEEETSGAGTVSLTFVCDPSHYRTLDKLATADHAGEGVSLHIVTNAVVGDVRVAEEGVAAAASPSRFCAAGPGAGAVAAPSSPGKAGDGGYAAAQPPKAPPASKGPRCSTCNLGFEDAADFRAHSKSELHGFNLKRKVKQLPPLNEEEYAEIALDVREGFIGVD